MGKRLKKSYLPKQHSRPTFIRASVIVKGRISPHRRNKADYMLDIYVDGHRRLAFNIRTWRVFSMRTCM